MSNAIEQITLTCGMPLLVENMPGMRSVAVRWLVPCGATIDPDDRLGTGEVLAELLARGAGSLDSRAQTDAFDRLGASRSVECGVRFMRVGSTLLGSNLQGVLPLLVDMIRDPKLPADGLDAARRLAQQQLESLKDDPQERAVLAARARHYPAPFDRSGLGTPEGLAAIDRDGLVKHWQKHAVPSGSVLAIAGEVDAPAVASQLNELLAGWEGHAQIPTLHGSGTRGTGHLPDESNQVQIVVVHDAPREGTRESVLERVVLAVLSGGMSSRLFTEVREKRGLCYAVHASYRAEHDFGSVTGYVGTTPERAAESLEVLVAELERIREGIQAEEFERAMIGLSSRVVFSGESSSARAGALANDFVQRGAARTLDAVREEIASVTLSEANAYLQGRSLGEYSVQTLGPEPMSASGA